MSVNKPGITCKPWECKSAHDTVRGTLSYGTSSNLHHRGIKSDKWCLCSVTVQRACTLLPSHLACIHLATSLDTHITYYQIIEKHSAWNSVYNQCNHIRGFKEENRTWEQSQNPIQHHYYLAPTKVCEFKLCNKLICHHPKYSFHSLCYYRSIASSIVISPESVI